MSATVKSITFATRQSGIPACDSVIINFTFGEVRCQYVGQSEVQTSAGTWRYDFYVHEEDLAGAMTLADFQGCNVVAENPWWCDQVEGEEPEENDCPARLIKCFVGVEILENLENEMYLGVLEYDETCDTFCLKAYPASDFLPEATPDRVALDYEVFSAPEPLQTAMATYVTHMPRSLAPIAGLRVSSAKQGDGPLTVNFTINGSNLTIAPITLSAGRTIEVAAAGLNPAFQGGFPIPNGAEVLAEVVSVAYDQYGNNWEGLRLAFRGRYTA